MFGAKHKPQSLPPGDPFEGRRLEGCGGETPSILDCCQDALAAGAYDSLVDLSPQGIVVRLDLSGVYCLAVIRFHPTTAGASLQMLHRSGDEDAELAGTLAHSAFATS